VETGDGSTSADTSVAYVMLCGVLMLGAVGAIRPVRREQ
jgi:hypothetical protein